MHKNPTRPELVDALRITLGDVVAFEDWRAETSDADFEVALCGIEALDPGEWTATLGSVNPYAATVAQACTDLPAFVRTR